MARLVTVAGTITGIPGVFQDKIDLDGGSQPGVLESGVVCIIGPCEGQIQPKVPYTFRNSQNLKELLGSGELYDACRFAFDPSREDKQEVRGAQKVIAVRANPATVGTLTLIGTGPVNLITLTSVPYGLQANHIAVTVAAGTLGAYSKKLTVSKFGGNDEVGDSLGFLPTFIIRYVGVGATATMTITNSSLTTTVGGVGDLNLSFATYNTITKLVNVINTDADYEAVIVTNKPDTFLCSQLDYVTAINIKTVSGTVSFATEVTETFTVDAGLVGLAANDILRIGASTYEYVFVRTMGPNAAARGYLDSTPATHAAAAAVIFRGAFAVNQAVIEWVTNYSERLTAVRHTSYAAGVPSTLTKTYLSGGSEGSIGSTDWQDALDAVRSWKYNFIVITSTDATPQGYLKTHLANKWGILGQEAVGHVGIATDSTKAQIKTRAKALQDANTCLWFEDVNREDDDGVDTNYAPWAMAAMAAGIQAGSAIGTPLVQKSLNVTAIGHATSIDLDDDTEDFIAYGVCVAKYDGDEYRIVRALSTYTNTDDAHMIEPAVRSALAWTVYKVRYNVRYRHLGKKAVTGNALSIKSTCRTSLEDCRDKDEAIVEGAKLVGGRRVVIEAFSDIQVSQTGNVIDLSYKCTPVNGNDFVRVKTTVVPFQDVA